MAVLPVQVPETHELTAKPRHASASLRALPMLNSYLACAALTHIGDRCISQTIKFAGRDVAFDLHIEPGGVEFLKPSAELGEIAGAQPGNGLFEFFNGHDSQDVPFDFDWRSALGSPLPACGERSDREAIRVRGTLDSARSSRLPLTPTLSPQAGRGSQPSSRLPFQLDSTPPETARSATPPRAEPVASCAGADAPRSSG